MNDGRVRRLGEELDELNRSIRAATGDSTGLVEELDYALRPQVHERRVPSFGAFVEPRTSLKEWTTGTGTEVSRRRVDDLQDATVRRFADGIASWAVRRNGKVDDLVVFDRSVSSERDLTILAAATGATIVQRHPNGTVRAVGEFGVLRHDGIDWQLIEPVDRWLDLGGCQIGSLDREVFERLLRFAVHDVAARRVGATFVVSPSGRLAPGSERPYGRPPEFRIDRPADLAPLYHVLGQLDGAAVFDERGALRQLGIQLMPSTVAETEVPAFRGARHTSALRYSFDDPEATVIVVSEDGPVSVLRAGMMLGQSG